MIHVGFISTADRARDTDESRVAALVASISEVGLLNPITVYARKITRAGQDVDGYGLIAGAHRLEAMKRLGNQEIPATIIELDDTRRIIAECDENLCGSNLTPSELAMFTAKRKAAYEALHPETIHGKNRSTESGKVCHSPAFHEDTAEKTGRSARAVRLDANRGENIAEDALSEVQGTKLDKGTYLDDLKATPLSEQAARVRRDLQSESKASTIDADIRDRAANEVAQIISEHVPGEMWDAIKANLYAAKASNIANALTNITGQSVMGGKWT